MFDGLKLLKALLCTLFVFIYTGSAQMPEETKKPEISIFGKEKSAFSQKFFEKQMILPEKKSPSDLLKKEIVKKSQDAAEPVNYKFRRGEKEWNIDLGYSPFEPTNFDGTKPYNTAGRKLGVAVFRWGRVIGTAKGITWQFLIEANPFIISLKNEVVNPEYVSPSETPNAAPTKRETSYGVGITPVAWRFYFLPKSRIKPYVQLGAGILYMNKPMPQPKTSKFNFTGYFGGGLMIHTSRKRAITFSYRYFHISNANTQRLNPGYNANVFAVGYSFFFK